MNNDNLHTDPMSAYNFDMFLSENCAKSHYAYSDVDRYIIGAKVIEILYEDENVYRYKIDWSDFMEVVIADDSSNAT